MLLAAWRAGAAVSGFPLPLVAPRLSNPIQMIAKLTGPDRRSAGARLWTGDLDIAAYSNNWDITREYIPSRKCAYCFRRYGVPFVEDEWHLFFVCPLYADLRVRLPFSAEEVCVEGHDIQGEGCTPRNLQALCRALLLTPSADIIADFLTQALKRRKRNRYR